MLNLSPEKWTDDKVFLSEFRRWLNKRYDRPAVPDEIVEAFTKPLQTLISNLEKDKNNGEVFQNFNNAIKEIRLRLPDTQSKPYFIYLLFLVKRHELSSEELSAIEFIYKQIVAHCSSVELIIDHETNMYVVSDYELSLSDYLDTIPFDLDDITYKGNQVFGEEPF